MVASGGNVMLAGRNADKLAAAAEEVEANAGAGGGQVCYEPADITDEDEVLQRLRLPLCSSPQTDLIVLQGSVARFLPA